MGRVYVCSVFVADDAMEVILAQGRYEDDPDTGQSQGNSRNSGHPLGRAAALLFS